MIPSPDRPILSYTTSESRPGKSSGKTLPSLVVVKFEFDDPLSPVDTAPDNCQSASMKKSTKKPAKKKPSRKSKPDQSQIALSVVEKAIGGKLTGETKANNR